MNCNILLMGLTGVGKSALVNYLAGEEIAESGISSRAGGMTRGIHKYNIEINNQKCNIFDSEGLEVSHADYWKKMINAELSKASKKTSLSKWYHIVVYCIGANSGRIQPFELGIIGELIKEGYGVIIAFTKADVVTNEELETLQNTIATHFNGNTQLIYVPICSVQTRTNTLEGKELLADAILEAWGKSLLYRLPEYIYPESLFREIVDRRGDIVESIEEYKVGFFGISTKDLINELNELVEEDVEHWNHKISEKFRIANKDINSVYQMLGTISNLQSLRIKNMANQFHISGVETSISSNSVIGNVAKTAAIGATIVMSPLIGVPLAIAAIVRSKSNNNQAKKQIIDAYTKQVNKLLTTYSKQKNELRKKLNSLC